MLRSGLTTTLLLAATCLTLRADFSRAELPGLYPLSSERVITCDGHNHVHRLSCDSGVIYVQAALFGRTDKETCSEGRPPQHLNNIKCSQKGVLEIFKKNCDGKKVCEFSRALLHSSDPCYGTYKYLDSTFLCIPAIHTVACEHSLAFLQCDEGQVISVLGADYGRHDTSTCSFNRPANQVQNTHCSRPTTKVAESCNGKSSCHVKASNSVFGDPCVGTYKYLEVAYSCQYPAIL